MEKCEMKFRSASSNSRGLSISKSTSILHPIDILNILKRRMFIYFVADTWNVLPVMPENDKSAGLWKVKVRSCFVSSDGNHVAGDQS